MSQKLDPIRTNEQQPSLKEFQESGKTENGEVQQQEPKNETLNEIRFENQNGNLSSGEQDQQQQQSRLDEQQTSGNVIDTLNSGGDPKAQHSVSQSSRIHNDANYNHIENLLTEDYGIILGQAKRLRKKAEEEAQVLANRIALLKQEELKGWKKIEETRKKTSDILKIKKQNEQRMKEAEQFKQSQESQVLNHKSSNTDLKQKKRDQMDLLRKDLEKSRFENYMQIKQVKEENEQRKQKMMEQQQAEIQRLHQKVKEGELKTMKKVNSFKIKQKRIIIQNHYQQEIEFEQRERAKKQQEISEMQKLELELINKLHSTQIQQKNAFQELEGLLNMKAEEYEQQFKKKKNTSQENLHSEKPIITETGYNKDQNNQELPYITGQLPSRPKKHRKKKKKHAPQELPKPKDFVF